MALTNVLAMAVSSQGSLKIRMTLAMGWAPGDWLHIGRDGREEMAPQWTRWERGDGSTVDEVGEMKGLHGGRCGREERAPQWTRWERSEGSTVDEVGEWRGLHSG